MKNFIRKLISKQTSMIIVNKNKTVLSWTIIFISGEIKYAADHQRKPCYVVIYVCVFSE